MCYLAALGRCTTLQECWSMQVPGRAWRQIICMRSILSVKFIDFGINWMVRIMWLAIVCISTLLVEAKRKTNRKSLEISEGLRFEVMNHASVETCVKSIVVYWKLCKDRFFRWVLVEREWGCFWHGTCGTTETVIAGEKSKRGSRVWDWSFKAYFY